MGHGKDVIEYTTPVSADDGKDGAGERDRLMGSNQAEGVSSSFKSPPYADADYLMQYIPSLARHRPEKSTWERIREWIGLPAKPKRDGQDDADLMSKRIEMIRNQAIMAVCVVTLNVAITAWAIVYYPPEGQGVGTFYTGACPTASAINSAAHVVLNALSTIFLGAGNYCMQILVAPSREEMDKAHKLGKTLEIGVPSLKNLFRISRRRVFGWVTLGIFAMTLHVFWNSAIFTSLPTVFIHRAVVTSDFMDATDSWALDDAVARIDEDRERNWPEKTPKRKPLPVNATVIYDMQAPAQTNSYTRIGTRECIEAFISPSNATRALVLVAQNMTSAQNGDSSLIDAAVFGWDADNSWASAWICEAYQKKEPWDFCLLKWAETEFIDDWTLAEPRVKIDSCLVGEEGDNSERCGLHYSTHVMGIVCGCTFIEFLLILAIWFQQRHTAKGALHDDDQNMSWEERKRKREARRTMTTVGDAIQSYLDNPGHVAFEERTEPGMWGIKYVKWKPQKDISWFKAVSVGAWIRAMTLFLLTIGLFSYFIGSSTASARATGIDLSPAVLWNQGFAVHPALTAASLGPLNTMGLSSTALMLWQILITNAAQVVISLLYIFYNSIFTRQLVADEWVRFLGEDGKKVLRVSAPNGMQRSTYFLSLPAKYSVPLMAVSSALHWLISQSIYLVQTRAYGPGMSSERIPSRDLTGRGYSVLGAVLALLFGGFLVAVVLINSGVRRYRDIPEGFQLMAYNSSGIQAMCQRPEKDKDASLFPIRMGVTNGPGEGRLGMAVPRLAFSTDINMITPVEGEDYYQPVLEPKGWWPWRNSRKDSSVDSRSQ